MRTLVILGDSPTKETGFARVVRKLLEHWLEARVFDQILIWGVGYWGMPHSYPAHVKIFPAAGPEDGRWESLANLQRFAGLLTSAKPTHLWMLQDVWGLHSLALLVKRMQEGGTRTACYFPVDAQLDPTWTDILGAVEFPVAYTEYGKSQATRALGVPNGDNKMDRLRREAIKRLRVIPHGVDECFTPLPGTRDDMRAELTGGEIGPGDTLLINVAVHQRRKGLTQTIQLYHALREQHPKLRLYLHCEPVNQSEGSSLPMVLRQLGIKKGVHFPPQSYFVHGRPTLADEKLNRLYNAADLFVSTSLGEGWGLPVTEAMGAGCPVAAPAHTSLLEIIGYGESTIYGDRGILLPLCPHPDMVIGDNSRLRHRVDVEGAAANIDYALRSPEVTSKRRRCAFEWVRRPEMQWGNIARRWLELFEIA